MKREEFFKEQEKLLNPHVPEPTGTAKLTFPDGKSMDLPVLTPSKGNKMIDIRNLHPKTGKKYNLIN